MRTPQTSDAEADARDAAEDAQYAAEDAGRCRLGRRTGPLCCAEDARHQIECWMLQRTLDETLGAGDDGRCCTGRAARDAGQETPRKTRSRTQHRTLTAAAAQDSGQDLEIVLDAGRTLDIGDDVGDLEDPGGRTQHRTLDRTLDGYHGTCTRLRRGHKV